MTKRILFLCTGNSARSQMAEAVARQQLGDQFEVFSAGTKPEGVDPRSLQVLTEAGYTTRELSSKAVETFASQSFDFVITLCDRARQECASYPDAEQMLAWDLPDPKQQSGNQLFVDVLHDIEQRVALFGQVHANAAPGFSELITFHKALSEELRLRCVLLLHHETELSVGELVNALQEIQPKVSRSLAQLKKQKLVSDRRQGQRIYYRLNPGLKPWQQELITIISNNHQPQLQPNLQLLHNALS